jgi:HSP20 family protein
MLPVRRGATERAEPMAYFDDVSNYMNRMMNSFFPAVDMTESAWTPLADVTENDKEYAVTVEVPGVKREDIDIEMDGQQLMVSGKWSEEARDGHVRRSTRRSGRFEYGVRFAHAVQADKCTAELKDGILTVTAPKTSGAEQKKIQIK